MTQLALQVHIVLLDHDTDRNMCVVSCCLSSQEIKEPETEMLLPFPSFFVEPLLETDNHTGNEDEV